MDKLFEALDREAEAEEEEKQEERASLVDHVEGEEINDEEEMAWKGFSELNVWDASPT